MSRKKRHHGEPQMSRHHKIAKSRGGDNEAPNNEKIRHDAHKAIHLIFGNEHTIEKLGTIISMDEAILQDHFKRAILDILRMSPQDVFLMEAFASRHGYKSLKTIQHE